MKSRTRVYGQQNRLCNNPLRIMTFSHLDPGTFKALDTNPGETLGLFNKYVDRIKLIIDLAFRKANGTKYQPRREKRKLYFYFVALTICSNCSNMLGVYWRRTLLIKYEKISNRLQSRTNSVVQRNLSLTDFP